VLKGKGVWNTGRHQTRLDFELTAKDAGKLLDRLGYGDTVRRGTARLAGDLQWSGPLTGLHYPTLSGQLTVAAQRAVQQAGAGRRQIARPDFAAIPAAAPDPRFSRYLQRWSGLRQHRGQAGDPQGVMRTTDPLRIFGRRRRSKCRARPT
jgi:hypothetical protein